jgi:hypothetical protein
MTSHDTMSSDWVFRYAGGCLIEFPPLELPELPTEWHLVAWVATVFRDPTSRSGWTTQLWENGAQRGWCIPGHLAVGDVLEFGLAARDRDGRTPPGWERRWFGWLRNATVIAIVVDGPYPDVLAADWAATSTVAEVRFSQLAAPQLNLAEPEDGADSDMDAEP